MYRRNLAQIPVHCCQFLGAMVSGDATPLVPRLLLSRILPMTKSLAEQTLRKIRFNF